MTERKRSISSYAREIRRLNAEIGRLPDRKRGKGKKQTRAWHRLVDRKTALLLEMWSSCPHPEAISGNFPLSPRKEDLMPLEICTSCGWDESAMFKGERLASSEKIPLDDAKFLVEFGKIIRRLGING